MHILITSSGAIYPYSLARLYADNPGTSFPDAMPLERLAEWGVFPVAPASPPAFDPQTQRVVEAQPQFVQGEWRQTWRVESLAPSEIAERAADQASVVRADRNARLSACDWTQLADAPVDSLAWANYRQALRDITAQAGFPWSVEWPAQPA
jgi:hypothetical protein